MTPDQLRAGYAPVARAYAAELSGELAGKPLDRALLRAFVETVTGPILEVGCGPGQIARFLADLGASVTGLDLSPEMIACARERHPDLGFVVGDMTALPHADASLAGIVAFYAIVHFATADLAPAFREFARVLAPGGAALVAFHAGDATVHVEALFGEPTSLDFMFHPPAAVIAALAAAGLALEARLDRKPYEGAEHASERCYLLVRRT